MDPKVNTSRQVEPVTLPDGMSLLYGYNSKWPISVYLLLLTSNI